MTEQPNIFHIVYDAVYPIFIRLGYTGYQADQLATACAAVASEKSHDINEGK